MNVVFLDFDGVLNSEKYVRECGYEGLVIDPEKMLLLKKLIETTNARIVLSTSWREHWSLRPNECDEMGRKINEIFAQHSLKIFSKTPDLSYRREEEIKQWLDECMMPTNFVVLDDAFLDSTGFLKGHFIKTSNYGGGLNEEHINEAIEILFEGKKLPYTADGFKKAVFDNCHINADKTKLDLTVNNFFGKNFPLKLTFFQVNTTKYVTDNGSAVGVLKARMGESYCPDIPFKICVAGNFFGDEIMDSYSQNNNFHFYLQSLICVANGDLIHNNILNTVYGYERAFDYTDAHFEELNVEEIFENLEKLIRVRMDENRFVVSSARGHYANLHESFFHIISPLGEGKFRISDGRRGRYEGEIMENFLWPRGNTDIRVHGEFLAPFLERFGGSLEYNEVSVTADEEVGMVNALMNFYNLAVLISKLCYNIELPKI